MCIQTRSTHYYNINIENDNDVYPVGENTCAAHSLHCHVIAPTT